MTSPSNPQPVAAPSVGVERTTLVQFNPQRIAGGFVRVSLAHAEFPDEQGSTVEQLKQTTDGRALAALAHSTCRPTPALRHPHDHVVSTEGHSHVSRESSDARQRLQRGRPS
jgi:hypothetical protein